ncbi:hypothetical protein [Mumia sp. DW29H23]|uniref:hypothetical protein n=1 Tax=Mumia sp. DW29H23 TaxID=3421241 RepID=UPI003D6972CF
MPTPPDELGDALALIASACGEATTSEKRTSEPSAAPTTAAVRPWITQERAQERLDEAATLALEAATGSYALEYAPPIDEEIEISGSWDLLRGASSWVMAGGAGDERVRVEIRGLESGAYLTMAVPHQPGAGCWMKMGRQDMTAAAEKGGLPTAAIGVMGDQYVGVLLEPVASAQQVDRRGRLLMDLPLADALALSAPSLGKKLLASMPEALDGLVVPVAVTLRPDGSYDELVMPLETTRDLLVEADAVTSEQAEQLQSFGSEVAIDYEGFGEPVTVEAPKRSAVVLLGKEIPARC